MLSKIKDIRDAIKSHLLNVTSNVFYGFDIPIDKFPAVVLVTESADLKLETIGRNYFNEVTYGIYVITQNDDPDTAFQDNISLVNSIFEELSSDPKLNSTALDSYFNKITFEYERRGQVTRHETRIPIIARFEE